MTLPNPLPCPNCGAPLPVAPGDIAVTCSHCGSAIRITSDGRAIPFFRTPAPDSPPETGMAATPPIPASPEILPTSDLDEIRRLAVQGQKIEAIKQYREKYDTSLAEAKAAVEALERGEQPPEWNAPAASGSEANVDWNALRTMVASGRKLEAIKLYRAQTGKSLEEALTVIDALPDSRPSASSSTCSWGCARVILGFVLFFFLIFAGCGMFVRSTDMHACVVQNVTSDGRIQDALGTPLTIHWFMPVLGYSSSSDFGGNTERSAGYYMLVQGPQGRSLLYVEAYHSSTGYFGMRANPVPNPNDFFIQASGDVSSCAGDQ